MNKKLTDNGNAEYSISDANSIILFSSHLVPANSQEKLESIIEDVLQRLDRVNKKISITIDPETYYQGRTELCIIGYIDGCVATNYYEKDLTPASNFIGEFRMAISEIYWRLAKEVEKRVNAGSLIRDEY